MKDADLQRFVEAYRLDIHNPGLAQTLAGLEKREGRPSDARTRAHVLQQLQPYLDFHDAVPFVTAPIGICPENGLVLATQQANNMQITIAGRHVLHDLGVYGPIGSGKTSFLLNLLSRLRGRGIQVIILDTKDDYAALAAADEQFLVLHANAQFNLLEQPAELSRKEFHAILVDALAAEYWGGELQRQVLTTALETTTRQVATPCLADVSQTLLRQSEARGIPFARKDALLGAHHRLERLRVLFPGLIETRHGPSWESLFARSIYIPSMFASEAARFVHGLYCTLLYLHQRRTNQRDQLKTVILVDEGISLVKRRQATISGQSQLLTLHPVLREWGIALIFSSVSFRAIDPVLRNNVGAHVVLGANDDEEARAVAATLGLNAEQNDYLRLTMGIGECLIKLGTGDWRYPLLGKFAQPLVDKTASNTAWDAAIERINQLPRTEPTTPFVPATEDAPKDAPTEQAPTAISVSGAALKLLLATSERLRTTTDAFSAAGLSRQRGATAKRELDGLKLLSSHQILVRGGSGGAGIIVTPTTLGWNHLSIAKPKTTRGGDGPQHAYLVQQIARALGDSTIEGRVGETFVDVLLRYDRTKHAKLATQCSMEWPQGTLLAIEVEINPLKTAANNLVKNAAAGIDLTIIAVLPKAVAKTVSAFPDEVVIDVFALLAEFKQ